MTITLLQGFLRLYTLMLPEGNRVKGAFALNEHRQHCDSNSPEAKCWCLTGGIGYVLGMDAIVDEVRKSPMVDCLYEALPAEFIEKELERQREMYASRNDDADAVGSPTSKLYALVHYNDSMDDGDILVLISNAMHYAIDQGMGRLQLEVA